MDGARALRSEVVGVLKGHALTIFGITDIAANKFFDKDAQDQSAQLQALRDKNTFLYAEDGTVHGPRMARYLRSDCIARVSLLIQSSTINNYSSGTPSHSAWPSSH